jgi:hypothetical protein
MVAECHQTAVGSSPAGTWAQQTRRELETSWANETPSREPCLTLAKRFSRVSGTRHRSACSKFERGGSGLRPSRWLGDRVQFSRLEVEL